MACCLTAPNHYLNRCWVIIKCIINLRVISQEVLKNLICTMFGYYTFKISNVSPKGQWVKSHIQTWTSSPLTIYRAAFDAVMSSLESFWTAPFILMSSPGTNPDLSTVQSAVTEPAVQQIPPTSRYLHNSNRPWNITRNTMDTYDGIVQDSICIATTLEIHDSNWL